LNGIINGSFWRDAWLKALLKRVLMVQKKASDRRTRRTHNPAFRAKVALAKLREDRTTLCVRIVVAPI
tara:strand:+ start:380 stop:583 length:204 start_codon:yes stop_codon:yes gene_type:complete